MNSFYISGDSSVLSASIPHLDVALKCVDTKLAATETKISLLSLIGWFDEGLKFVETTKIEDYKREYQKETTKYFFLAKTSEALGNIKEYQSNLIKAVQLVQEVISRNEKASSKFNIEVYYDLFLLKSLYLHKEEILKEIDLLEKKYPLEESISYLRGTFESESTITVDVRKKE